jgi:hypothetical protein
MKQSETKSPSSDRDRAAPKTSTPGRPGDTSRQQKHEDQHLDSGSEHLDRKSGNEGPQEAPTPPGSK